MHMKILKTNQNSRLNKKKLQKNICISKQPVNGKMEQVTSTSTDTFSTLFQQSSSLRVHQYTQFTAVRAQSKD